MYKKLDPIIHPPVRLAIMSILINFKSAEFSYLLDNIDTTKGNLSFQMKKLNEAEYIEIRKSFKGNYPLTTCTITMKGIEAYKVYFDSISSYFRKVDSPD
ncbi:transcriptional regulator [uncultured Sunxiuqinia sp.]|uniref:winged helix-turn-helix domain-containing protein n=1 Tax=uncultured Sunxiuqinia sp. TaxID=1573825 RepID=UPI002AA80082|nr:transcriptional regulator [uncultured Sunxiuqinia sp.]